MEWDSKLKDFFVSNEETKQAVCNLCNKIVSFETTVINLIQHLALAHPEALLNNFPVVISNQEELSDDDSSPVVISCDSLSFFETFEGSSTATCTLCLQKVSFKTSRSNLEQHLKIKHAEIYKNFISSKSPTPQNGAEEGKNYEENENSLETDNGSEKVSSELVFNSEAEIILPSDEDYIIISSKPDTTKRKHTSPVWKIFDRIPNTEVATCTLCQKIISYKSTRGNLKSHIRRIHPVAYNIHFVPSKSATSKIGSEENNSDAENSHLEINPEDEYLIEKNTLNSSKVTRKIRSNLWNFFDKISNTQTAKCTLCQRIISYKSTRANLKSHLKRIHPVAYHKQFISSKSLNGPDKESDFENNNSDEEKSLGNKSEDEHLLEDNMLKSPKTIRKNISDLWNFFDKIPNTQMATCILCRKNLSYRTTTNNLKSHLKKMHSKAYNLHFASSISGTPQNSSEENDLKQETSHVENNNSGEEQSLENDSEDEHLLEDNMFNSSQTIRKNRSDLWNFFDKIPNTQTATCIFCRKNLSYRTTTNNLRHHMKKRHPMFYHSQYILSQSATAQNSSEEGSGEINLYEENSHAENNSEDECLLEDNISSSRRNRNHVWNFFNRIPNTETATCTLCQKIISYRSTRADLISHIKRIHPSVYHKNGISTKSTSPQIRNEENNLDENFLVENNSDDEHLLEENMLKSSKEKKRAAVDLEVARTNRFDFWKVFDRIQNTKMATCTLCQKNISYKSTTGNLRNHIRRLHPETYLHMSEGLNEIEGATSKNEDFHVGNNSEEKYLHKNSMLNSSGRYKSKINMEFTGEDYCSEKFRHNFGNSSRYRNSAILNFFERNDKTKMFRCKLCLNIISYKSTIMHLKRHLKNKHKSEYLDYSSRLASPSKNIYEVYISAGEDQEQEVSKEKSTNFNFDKMNQIARDTQMDPFDSDENIIKEPPKKMQRIRSINWADKIQPDERKNIDRYLLKLITEDFQPFSIVEDKGFQEFISVLNPNYQLPTQKTLSTLLAEEYTNKLAKFKEITHSCSSVSLSVDCWSSRNMQRFMTVTAHFINQNTFEFYSVFIQNVGLHKQDTAEDIATQLRQATSQWDIINKVKFIVFDNEPNMVSAARILNWPHFICFANTFNSIVQGALNDISIAEIVAKVQKAVAYIKRTSAAKEMLHEYQVKTQQVAQPKSLASAIPTCWITICKMLKRFSELQKAVCATLSNIDEEIPAITSDEWQCINQLVEILKPFEEAATIMSSEKYLIAGKAVVLMAGLYKVCIDLAERSFCEPVSNLILKLKNDLSTKFGDLEDNEEISVCTLLDPRFKQHAFEDHIAMLNAKESVLEKLKHLNNGHRVNSAGSSSTTISNADSSLLGRFYTKVASSYQPERTEHRTMDELNRYLSENVIPPTECSLRWWKERRMLYPSLCKIFVDCSNIVVTSLPCDRAFSKTGYILSDRLNGLTTSKLDQIMFLNVNK